MIVDRIENSHLYAGLSKGLAKAFEILKDDKLTGRSDGRYELPCDDIYYIVQRYTTKPLKNGRLEAHRKYIDVQFIVTGRELLGCVPVAPVRNKISNGIDNSEITEPYNPENDVVFYRVPDKISTVNLETGMFCVLFPQDAHIPGCQIDEPAEVHKVVIKVRT